MKSSNSLENFAEVVKAEQNENENKEENNVKVI
jgi:hypothetical protein